MRSIIVSMKIKANNLIGFLLLIAFIGASVFSFSHALQMAEGGHHAGDCPITTGPESLCTLTPFAHLTFWQKTLIFNPGIDTLLLLIASVVFVIYVRRFLTDNYSPPSSSQIRTFNAQLPLDLYTRIFSDGLLNPKVQKF
ncbi:MAG: hypothetical protein JWM14_2780 [Chitinophagaceae bacterium]|nr:hypothetical protein [Chitinophagaceae bacterium]